MADRTFERLWRAIRDVHGRAEGWRAGVLRIIALFAVAGIPVSAIFNQEDLLPPTLAGKLLWFGAILAALLLGVQAVYLKLRELDSRTDEARVARTVHRRKVLERMRRVVMAAERIRAAQRLSGIGRRAPANLGLFEEARGELRNAVVGYEEEALRAHHAEAILHVQFCARLRVILDHDESLLGLWAVLGDLARLHARLTSLEEPLHKDELKVVLDGIEQIRANRTESAEP